MLIVPPRHTFSYTGPQEIKYHWFALEGQWPQFLGPSEVQILSFGGDAEVEDMFIAMREILILRKPGYPLRAVGVFYELTARLEEISDTSHAPESGYPETVRNAIVYLRENYAAPFNAAKTAAAVGLSSSRLRALFEKWLGESPKRFHTRCRINQAKRLLSEQNLRVAEVGFHVGFEDVHHFSRVFKQITGVAPSHYAERKHPPI
jgi:AraC-like DNA-binding protein